jgi:hypothetical protein
MWDCCSVDATTDAQCWTVCCRLLLCPVPGCCSTLCCSWCASVNASGLDCNLQLAARTPVMSPETPWPPPVDHTHRAGLNRELELDVGRMPAWAWCGHCEACPARACDLDRWPNVLDSFPCTRTNIKNRGKAKKPPKLRSKNPPLTLHKLKQFLNHWSTFSRAYLDLKKIKYLSQILRSNERLPRTRDLRKPLKSEIFGCRFLE